MTKYKILLLYCCPIFLIELYGKLLNYPECIVYIRELQTISPIELRLYDAVIPCDVYSQTYLNKNIKNCFTNKNENLYEILDNKKTFHIFFKNYYKKYKIKKIKLIRTFIDLNQNNIKNFVNCYN